MNYCIGFDGGGTKTLAYLGTMEGNVIDRMTLGPSNYYSVGVEAAKEVFLDAIRFFEKKHDFENNQLAFLSLGLAGVDREIDKIFIKNLLVHDGITCDIFVNNDSRAALAGAFLKEEGIMMIAGTGSVVLGIRNGVAYRAGGWGHLLADEGSGFNIGMKGLRSVMKAYDGRLEQTVLTERILKNLCIQNPEDIIGFIHGPLADKKRIAEIALLVAECADQGDQVALNIIDEAAKELTEMAIAVIRKLYHEQDIIPMSFMGGVITHVERLRKGVESRLCVFYSKLQLSPPAFDAGVGALIIGWNQYGIEFNRDRITR
ncbi:MAG: hypothetical protein JXQ26_07330 [Tissierellales bacterium]|nr:hypothetical protein [Tissierellales bacterium]MBN2827785.1 hypothetical protein [Tissierellales bacterium]